MRLLRLLAVALVGLACCAAGRAETPSPLRLIPAEADFVVQVQQPQRVAALIRSMDLLRQVQQFAIVKEQLDSTQARRGRQLLAYVEKTLGTKWPDLVERLAGGGVALAGKFAGGNAPILLVIQGNDEQMMKKFVELALSVIRDELARQESKDEVKKGDYKGIPGWKIGQNLLVAQAGAALVVSNNKDALGRALDLHLGAQKKSLAEHEGVREASKLLPEKPLVNAWVSLKPLHDSPAGKDLYKTPRDNSQLTVLFGAIIDVIGRSPFLAAGLHERPDGALLTFRVPRGTDGMGPDRDLHVPPADKATVRPLLEPPGVLYSSSFYLDVARIWKDREKLFPKVQADGLTAFDKTSGRVLGGVKLSTLLESAGARHRVVVTRQGNTGYKKVPRQAIPAFAFVAEMHQPDRFARAMDTLLRFGGLIASNQFELHLSEKKHNGCDIVGYRFDEKAELKGDVNDIRFNFSPCFARVDDQFVFCSTMDLCEKLIDQLVAERKAPAKGIEAGGIDRAYSAGLASFLEAIQDQLIAQTILDQAVPPGEAKEEVASFIKLVARLGTLSQKAWYAAGSSGYDIRLRTGK
jgi:hypothetical protein